jgi:hypothetical protein
MRDCLPAGPEGRRELDVSIHAGELHSIPPVGAHLVSQDLIIARLYIHEAKNVPINKSMQHINAMHGRMRSHTSPSFGEFHRAVDPRVHKLSHDGTVRVKHVYTQKTEQQGY